MAGENPSALELHFLQTQLSRVLSIANGCVKDISIAEEDDFGFMAMAFLCKQIDHAESVSLLLPRRDAVLIARTMFDGLCQLSWAYKDPKNCGHAWRSFCFVHDWRTLQQQRANGELIDPKIASRIEKAVAKFGVQFLKKKKSKKSDSDPYHKTWLAGKTLRDIAEQVEGRDLYDIAYSSMSDWEHWGNAGIGDAITRTGTHRITFTTNSDKCTWQALTMAFQAVFQTVQMVDAHLQLGNEASLNELYVEFIDGMEKLRPSK